MPMRQSEEVFHQRWEKPLQRSIPLTNNHPKPDYVDIPDIRVSPRAAYPQDLPPAKPCPCFVPRRRGSTLYFFSRAVLLTHRGWQEEDIDGYLGRPDYVSSRTGEGGSPLELFIAARVVRKEQELRALHEAHAA